MKRKNGRYSKILNRSWHGIGRWVIQHYLNDCLICETVRNNRKDARKVARNYTETGMIPLN